MWHNTSSGGQPINEAIGHRHEEEIGDTSVQVCIQVCVNACMNAYHEQSNSAISMYML